MAETKNLTLTEFVLARIAEDEARVEAWGSRGVLWPHEEHDPGECDECDYRRGHRAADDLLHDRLAAECAAKRQIVERCTGAPSWLDWDGDIQWLADFVLRDLAGIWADHPDYREEWRP